MVSQIFTTFGLMILFRGIAQFLWKPDYRTVGASIVNGHVTLAGIQIGLPQVVAELLIDDVPSPSEADPETSSPGVQVLVAG